MTTILIVDDEASIRFALSEVLADRGHDTIEARPVTDWLNDWDWLDPQWRYVHQIGERLSPNVWISAATAS